MPAFNPTQMSHIYSAINVHAENAVRLLRMPELTQEQVLNLVAPPDHHDVIIRTRDVLGLRYGGTATAPVAMPGRVDGLPPVCMTIGDNTGKLYLPSPNKLHGQDVERELLDQLVHLSRQYAEICVEWGRVKAVVEKLNELCPTPKHVRYYWPSILALMTSEALAPLRNAIVASHQPRFPVTLPLELRQACREAARTVGLTALTPDVDPHTPSFYVEFSCNKHAFFKDSSGFEFSILPPSI